MTTNPLIQQRIKSARSSLQNLGNVKQVMSNQLYNLMLIRNFFQKYNSVINSDGSNYDDALEAGKSTLPVDKSNTPRNEGVSYEQFLDIVRKFYGDMANDGIDYEESKMFDAENIDTHSNDPNSIGHKVRQIISQRMQIDSEMDATEAEISDLTNDSQSDGKEL